MTSLRSCVAVALAACDGGNAGRQAGRVPTPATTWPGPDNTGVPAGTDLARVNDLVVSAPGVVEGKDVVGCLAVNASNVTIRRVRVRGCKGGPSINVGYDRTGVVIEDCEVDGSNLNANATAVGYGGFTMRRCNIHNAGSGVQMANGVTLEDNWIHDLYEGPDSHNDDVLTNGGAHLVVRHNTLENSRDQTATVALYGDFAPVNDVLVERNLLQGGGWAVYAGTDPGKRYGGAARAVRFFDNHFGTKFFPRCGAFGPVTGFDPNRPGNAWSGNVWHDTGAAVDF